MTYSEKTIRLIADTLILCVVWCGNAIAGEWVHIETFNYEGDASYWVAHSNIKTTRPLYDIDMRTKRLIGRVDIGTPCADSEVVVEWAATVRRITHGKTHEGKPILGLAYCSDQYTFEGFIS